MRNIIIIGSSKQAYHVTHVFLPLPKMKIIAIIGKNLSEKFIELARMHHIEVVASIEELPRDDIHLVINTTDNRQDEQLIMQSFSPKPLLISKSLIDLLLPFLREQYFENDNFRLILNSIRDGLIVVDHKGYIRFLNQTAFQLINCNEKAIGKHISQVIPHSKLPMILQSEKKEVNKPFSLRSKDDIVTTRIPLINNRNLLIGAIAIFKEKNEIIRLAEENTDLKKIKTMLEAIIYASEEAISVVDEEGKGLMINPAYTRITGLSETDVIGKPASVDISEGESIHMQVLRTQKAIRGAKLKVGPANKEVFVNVAPIIVADKIKGSVAVIHDISNIEQLTSELKRAQQKIRELEATYSFDDIIGKSDEIKLAIKQAKMAATTPATVLLRGASGTGKELFAHAIHNASDRKHHKFIRVNCAALAESVLESELFGYEDGAFTGAKTGGKKGLFEVANKGSVFLDEVGELSLTTQAKLLRVLQEKEIVRVGGTRPIPIDVRIIAATNANLEKMIKDHTFREDLYYRLNRLPIYIPSLHERIDDLPSLVHFIIAKVNQLYGRMVESISASALKKLQHYDWPGNVRELENVISRAIIFMDISDHTIEYDHIIDLGQNQPVKNETNDREGIGTQSLKEAMEAHEKQLIKQVYKANDFNKTKTAEQLKISVRSLYYKLERYGIA